MKNVNINFEEFKKNNNPLNLVILDKKLEDYLIMPNLSIIGPRKKTLTVQKDVWGYPIIKMRGKYYKLHLIIANLFIFNEDINNKPYVDHIDRNKDNFSPENLRWVSQKENQNNKTSKKWTHNIRYDSYLDKSLTILVKSYTDEDIYNFPKKEVGITYKESIRRSIKAKKPFDGYYWKMTDLELIGYLKLTNSSFKDFETNWVTHYSGKFKIHPLGVVMNRGGITVGFLHSSKDSNHPVRAIHSGRKRYLVHRLVSEVFLNGNKPLDKDQIVDHLNTNSLDNRVSNLKICSQKENMNNKLTRQKVSKPIINTNNGKIYNSITECAKDNNVTVSSIWARLNGRRPSRGFKYLK